MERTVRCSPEEVSRRVEEARALLARNEVPSAFILLEGLDDLPGCEPTVSFLRGLGMLLSGDDASAIACFDRTLALDPDHAHARCHRGSVRLRLGDRRGGREDLERAVELAPDCGLFLRELAGACVVLQDPVGVREAATRALRFLPRDGAVHGFLAWAEEMDGNREAAIRRFRRALELDPTRTSDWLHLARLGGIADPAELECRLEEPKLAGVDRAAIGYALGEVHKRAGRPRDAFEAWDRAAHSFEPDYHAAAYDAIAGELIARANAPFFERPCGGDPTRAPIFIVGMPRSGTSLVERILGAHPDIEALGERMEMSELAVDLAGATGKGVGYPRGLRDLTPKVESHLAARYLASLRPDPSRARFTDKAPANFVNLALIARLFPNARVIATQRDPRDVALSCFSTWFGADRCRFSYGLDTIRHFQATHDRLMSHWRAVLPLPILEVRYEDLVQGGEPQLRRLIEFTGLPFDPACARFHEKGPLCFTASNEQVREPLHPRSIGRWREYGDTFACCA
ncbi:MAG TPA: tetratricopeptide repeat protein [Planctomycetes bacterium]|nr:tetratricopeptide repeat protein [Planctomycetota bacterium]